MNASLGAPARTDRGAILKRVGLPIAVLVGAMLLAPIGDIRPLRGVALSFRDTGPGAAVLDLAAGQVLLLAGAIAWLLGAPRRVSLLAILAGVAWFGPDLWALTRADPTTRAIGRFLLTPMLPVLLVHLGAAALGVDRGPRARMAIAAAYVACIGVAVISAVAYDAVLDANVTDESFRNPWLVASGVGMGLLRVLAAVTQLGVGAIAFALVAGWPRRRGHGPRVRLLIGVGLAAAGAGAVSTAVLLLVSPLQDLHLPEWTAVAVVGIVAAVCLAVGVLGQAFAAWRRVDRMRRMADPLEDAPAPGTLGDALARALGDPTLRVGYLLEDGRLVAADGAPMAPVGEDAIAAWTETPVERDGMTVAVIWHAAGVDAAAIGASLGPALLVALDNERLRAARLARMVELRASRARIVAVGDAERRRLERDLHDGVQQQLLTILFDLRLARLAAERSGDPSQAVRLAVAEGRAQTAIDALRRIAHGIHPAVLSRSGLRPALASLAEEAPLPVDVAADSVGRLPDAVEAAAYQVVMESVTDAAAQGATGVEVRAAVEAEVLVLEVRLDGAAPDSVPIHIADRVGAAGGSVAMDALSAGGTLLRVELPCG